MECNYGLLTLLLPAVTASPWRSGAPPTAALTHWRNAEVAIERLNCHLVTPKTPKGGPNGEPQAGSPFLCRILCSQSACIRAMGPDPGGLALQSAQRALSLALLNQVRTLATHIEPI